MTSPTKTLPLTSDAIRMAREAFETRGRTSLLVYHPGGTEVVPLSPGTRVVLGREAPADVVIVDPSLSREHARFEVHDDALYVEDLGSTNGTTVDGQRITGRTRFAPGAEIVMGTVAAYAHAADGVGAPPITRVETHEQFLSRLQDELARSAEFGRPLSVMMLRALGGEAITDCTGSVAAALRAVDRPALYSDGLVEVVCPEADAAEVRVLAEAAIAAADRRLVAGVATVPGAPSDIESLVEALRDAVRSADAKVRVRTIAAVSLARSDAADTRPVEGARMKQVFAQIDRLANARIPVLLVGETGAGKEIVAQQIHERSSRRDRPLVSVNCAAIPAALVEDTLFGHVRGAFTGAEDASDGLFIAADAGTIFLDEIGELPLPVQAALLRVVETKRVRRLGSTDEVEVDVRIVAATHRDLEQMVEAGTFRRDLLFRLETMTLAVPPLRERVDEIRPLAERFLARANASNGRAVERIADEAWALLHLYRWPGNIRELKNAIERAVVIAPDHTIEVEDLPERIRGATEAASAPPVPAKKDLRSLVQAYETELIREALAKTNGNQTAAAELLGLPRRTLAHRIRALQILRSGDE